MHVGASVVDLTFLSQGTTLTVTLKTLNGPPIQLKTAVPDSKTAGVALHLPLPSVQVALDHRLPLPGSRTAQMKVVAETPSAHALTLELEGVAGTEARLRIVRNRPGIHVHSESATLTAEELVISSRRATATGPSACA